MTGQVPNPYRAAIVSARSRSTDEAQTLRTLLDTAVTAMESGAWVGGKADHFFTDLTGFRTDAKKAASDSMDEFDDAIAAQPEKVDQNSWQVHWHNLGP